MCCQTMGDAATVASAEVKFSVTWDGTWINIAVSVTWNGMSGI